MKYLCKYIAWPLLVLYAFYAVSPLYSSLSIGANSGEQNVSTCSVDELPFGILMLNIMLSPLMDDRTTIPSNSDANNIDFLIKKKRAVTREEPLVAPLLSTTVIPPENPAPILSACSHYDTLHHCRHQAPDGYFSLDSGLSPPVSLS